MSVMYFSRHKNRHIDQTIHSEITAHFFSLFFPVVLKCALSRTYIIRRKKNRKNI